ncbi:MAG: hypothetical protein ACOYMU_04090 [Phycisphaerales bacterium]
MNLTQQRTAAIVGLAAILFAVGCNPTVFTPNQNDALRRQVRDLEEQVNAAKAKQVELEQQLVQSAKSAEEKSSIDPAILAATPHVASVQIGGSSGFLASKVGVETGGCTARIYLEPSDGLGRFLQIVGSVQISVFDLKAGGKSQTLGTAEFSPSQVRDAWRGGILGSHYTFEIPLAGSDWNCQGSVTAKLEFHDGTTGKIFTAERQLIQQK